MNVFGKISYGPFVAGDMCKTISFFSAVPASVSRFVQVLLTGLSGFRPNSLQVLHLFLHLERLVLRLLELLLPCQLGFRNVVFLFFLFLFFLQLQLAELQPLAHFPLLPFSSLFSTLPSSSGISLGGFGDGFFFAHLPLSSLLSFLSGPLPLSFGYRRLCLKKNDHVKHAVLKLCNLQSSLEMLMVTGAGRAAASPG